MEFSVRFEQQKIDDLRADFRMCDMDEDDLKKDLKHQIRLHQQQRNYLKKQWKELNRAKEDRREGVMVKWSNDMENDVVSGLTHEAPATPQVNVVSLETKEVSVVDKINEFDKEKAEEQKKKKKMKKRQRKKKKKQKKRRKPV